jgi:hypothetical protein
MTNKEIDEMVNSYEEKIDKCETEEEIKNVNKSFREKYGDSMDNMMEYVFCKMNGYEYSDNICPNN